MSVLYSIVILSGFYLVSSYHVSCYLSIKWCCLRDPTFSRFGTVPAGDRRTGRRSIASQARCVAPVKWMFRTSLKTTGCGIGSKHGGKA